MTVFPGRFLAPFRPNVNRRKPVTEEQVIAAQVAAQAETQSDFRAVPPIFKGHVRLLRWANTNANGMTVTLHLEDGSEFPSHPFKGLYASRKADGQRLNMAVTFPVAWGQEEMPQSVYVGEATLVWWSDDCKDGMKVTMRLAAGPDGAGLVHPFDGLNTGSAKDGEQLFMAVWAIADDERPTDPRKQKKRKSFHECSPTQQAHILCGDDRFAVWLNRRLDDIVSNAQDLRVLIDIDTKTFCEAVIKSYCGIKSRSEFSGDSPQAEEARQRWATLVTAYDNDVRGRLGN